MASEQLTVPEVKAVIRAAESAIKAARTPKRRQLCGINSPNLYQGF